MMTLDLQQPYHFFKIVRIMIKIEMKMYKYKKELEENYAAISKIGSKGIKDAELSLMI